MRSRSVSSASEVCWFVPHKCVDTGNLRERPNVAADAQLAVSVYAALGGDYHGCGERLERRRAAMPGPLGGLKQQREVGR